MTPAAHRRTPPWQHTLAATHHRVPTHPLVQMDGPPGLVGALPGTFLIPIPLLGSLIGACIGAGLGAWGLELWGGREHHVAVKAAVGAGVGRFVGTMVKLAAGVLIWLVVAVAALWP